MPYLTVTVLGGATLVYLGRLDLDMHTVFLNLSLVQISTTQPNVVLPQAWSLAIELNFYLIAALLFTSRMGIVIALIAGAFLRFWFAYAGDRVDIMYTPSVFVFFALGGMSYLLYMWTRALPTKAAWAGAVIGGISLLLYAYMKGGFLPPLSAESTDWRFLLFYTMLAASLPFLFVVSNNSSADRVIGEISYPIYLVHILYHRHARSDARRRQSTEVCHSGGYHGPGQRALALRIEQAHE